MRFFNIFWSFILILVIAFIAYEVVNETVVKPVRAIQNEIHENIEQAFRLLEP